MFKSYLDKYQEPLNVHGVLPCHCFCLLLILLARLVWSLQVCVFMRVCSSSKQIQIRFKWLCGSGIGCRLCLLLWERCFLSICSAHGFQTTLHLTSRHVDSDTSHIAHYVLYNLQQQIIITSEALHCENKKLNQVQRKKLKIKRTVS